MRNLTIRREKSAVASLESMKVYIEDPFSDEITINDVPCRKLGNLKNGEEATFQIENRAARVFVIADKLSKDFVNEYYQLPAGEDDIFLSGKNQYDLAGNGFRFDGNESEDVMENRKNTKKKGRVFLIIALIGGIVLGSLVGRGLFPARKPKEKVFNSKGLTITLTDEFKESDGDEFGYTVVFDSRKMAVFALQEPFTLLEGFGDYTLDEYTEIVMIANGMSSDQKKTKGGLPCIEYDFTNPDTKDTYHYYAFTYKADNAFWLVQFATLAKDASQYEDQIVKWAQQVRFN